MIERTFAGRARRRDWYEWRRRRACALQFVSYIDMWNGRRRSFCVNYLAV